MSNGFRFRESMCYMMENNPTERVNAEYVEDVKAYLQSPVPSCNKEQSLKLLKNFYKADFSIFWTQSVAKYFPAVSEGTMKIAEKVYPHDHAVCYARKLADTFDAKELARAFLYGVAHNATEYRSALACYYYIKNLPEHQFEKELIGISGSGKVYMESACEICRYNSKLSSEPKMQFFHINLDMYNFYYVGRIGFCIYLNTAVVYLEEYKTLPVPECSPEDLQFFNEIIALIESLPQNTTPARLRKELKSSGLLKMTIEQIDAFIEVLGFLNILHTDDSFGVTARHTKKREMLESSSFRSNFAHPVSRWTRKNGIDYAMIDMLFGDLY